MKYVIVASSIRLARTKREERPEYAEARLVTRPEALQGFMPDGETAFVIVEHGLSAEMLDAVRACGVRA